MNKNLKNRIKAFSLAEMMIVMLVVSILTAAMMPILTRKENSKEHHLVERILYGRFLLLIQMIYILKIMQLLGRKF